MSAGSSGTRRPASRKPALIEIEDISVLDNMQERPRFSADAIKRHIDHRAQLAKLKFLEDLDRLEAEQPPKPVPNHTNLLQPSALPHNDPPVRSTTPTPIPTSSSAANTSELASKRKRIIPMMHAKEVTDKEMDELYSRVTSPKPRQKSFSRVTLTKTITSQSPTKSKRENISLIDDDYEVVRKTGARSDRFKPTGNNVGLSIFEGDIDDSDQNEEDDIEEIRSDSSDDSFEVLGQEVLEVSDDDDDAYVPGGRRRKNKRRNGYDDPETGFVVDDEELYTTGEDDSSEDDSEAEILVAGERGRGKDLDDFVVSDDEIIMSDTDTAFLDLNKSISPEKRKRKNSVTPPRKQKKHAPLKKSSTQDSTSTKASTQDSDIVVKSSKRKHPKVVVSDDEDIDSRSSILQQTVDEIHDSGFTGSPIMPQSVKKKSTVAAGSSNDLGKEVNSSKLQKMNAEKLSKLSRKLIAKETQNPGKKKHNPVVALSDAREIKKDKKQLKSSLPSSSKRPRLSHDDEVVVIDDEPLPPLSSKTSQTTQRKQAHSVASKTPSTPPKTSSTPSTKLGSKSMMSSKPVSAIKPTAAARPTAAVIPTAASLKLKKQNAASKLPSGKSVTTSKPVQATKKPSSPLGKSESTKKPSPQASTAKPPTVTKAPSKSPSPSNNAASKPKSNKPSPTPPLATPKTSTPSKPPQTNPSSAAQPSKSATEVTTSTLQPKKKVTTLPSRVRSSGSIFLETDHQKKLAKKKKELSKLDYLFEAPDDDDNDVADPFTMETPDKTKTQDVEKEKSTEPETRADKTDAMRDFLKSLEEPSTNDAESADGLINTKDLDDVMQALRTPDVTGQLSQDKSSSDLTLISPVSNQESPAPVKEVAVEEHPTIELSDDEDEDVASEEMTSRGRGVTPRPNLFVPDESDSEEHITVDGMGKFQLEVLEVSSDSDSDSDPELLDEADYRRAIAGI